MSGLRMTYEGELLEERYLKKLKGWIPLYSFTHKFGPAGYIMPEMYRDVLRRMDNFEVREDDVWTTGYMGTGITCVMEIAWLIVNDLNFDVAKSVQHFQRIPSTEIGAFVAPKNNGIVPGDPIDYIDAMKSPRCIRTHAPYEMLPPQIKTVKPKIIYMLRNPKDVWCCYFPIFQRYFGMNAPFEEAAKQFCEGKMPRGCPIEHCLSMWGIRHEPNVKIVTYEDLVEDTKKEIKELGEFLGKSLTDDQIEKINDYVSFDNMKRNPAVNMENLRKLDSTKGVLVEKGSMERKCGVWKDVMSSEMSAMFDEWIRRKTKGTDLVFKYC